MMSRVLTCIRIAAMILAGASVAEAQIDCTNDSLGVAASIEEIYPPGQRLEIRNGTRRRMAGNRECLQPGDIVIVPAGVEHATLFDGSDLIDVTARSKPFEAKAAPRGAIAGAASYLQSLIKSAGRQEVLPKPKLTGVRGETHPLRLIPTLEPLAREQRVVPSLLPAGVTLVWNEGRAPYRCSLQPTAASTEKPVAANTANSQWCTLKLLDTTKQQLTLRDASDQPRLWTLESADRKQVPRPRWIATADVALTAVDSAAWGLWLIEEAGPEWQLLGFSMIAHAQRESWAAGYYFSQIIHGEK